MYRRKDCQSETSSQTYHIWEIFKLRADMRRTGLHLLRGGKSPCIVEKTANLKLAAKRIIFGKFLNCGQTCVAPDYIYCDKEIKDSLIQELKKQIVRQFGSTPLANADYGKIINAKHFSRILTLIDTEKTVWGGKFDSDTLQIEPTLLDRVTFKDAVMQEEIFGPVLPIVTYDSLDHAIAKINSMPHPLIEPTLLDRVTFKDAVMQEEIFGPVLPIVTYDSLDHAIAKINSMPHPLALYLFTSDQKIVKKVTARCSFGGGCINDVVIHLATSEMGFGGFGESGMGAYHGKDGFDTFSHYKSIVNKRTWMDLPMRYQPYKKTNETLLRFFLK